MVGGGSTERPVPDWLEKKLQKSQYQGVGENYYRNHYPNNHLYVEVTRDGLILFYDGWDYKRGLKLGRDGIETAEFARIPVEGRWDGELASAICFARRARKWYGWNIVPVFNGYELKIPP